MLIDDPVLVPHVIVGGLSGGFGTAKLNPVRTASATIVANIYLYFILFCSGLFIFRFLGGHSRGDPYSSLYVRAPAIAVAPGEFLGGLVFPFLSHYSGNGGPKYRKILRIFAIDPDYKARKASGWTIGLREMNPSRKGWTRICTNSHQ